MCANHLSDYMSIVLNTFYEYHWRNGPKYRRNFFEMYLKAGRVETFIRFIFFGNNCLAPGFMPLYLYH